ncbi:DEAD/DEAH box helicase [Candidatus Peribacteria bacterium]|jgi:ATP-dependent RNA helicase RhlE|nr:DEAD/DEAH box helicase [Candidatus Peribacteria bacterium]MBT4021458.1 DEAD/DEAH box helicase [Candidatus Peribacteria bacterium]MBT4240368.1 DEAD/DEAH box helicase [Candidatus Peribacteria bacterium]MBT4473791.1 DEAD/DEAH box helicase [Candidatus Peribacteria bacterium]
MNESDKKDKRYDDFSSMGINPKILKILEKQKISRPTPIQHQAIPSGLKGKDLIGVAQTGTGKTFAFGIPMLQQLSSGKKRGLIVLPTRELAYQVEEALKPFASALGIRMAVFVGGASMQLQRRDIKRNPRILIATPGRLNDHLERKTVSLKEVELLVLDEADRMLDMGFKPQINKILSHIPRERQTLLFSATMPQDIVKLATAQMNLPLRIEVAPAGTAAAKVEQELIIVRQHDKQSLLISLIKEFKGQVLVFSRTKHGAKKITHALNEADFRAAEIHSNRSLVQRRKALEGFKRGSYQVLVATDIASRGIDVTDIGLVINYDLPDDPSDYVHRIGRTGRADREGLAISFATPTQAKHIRDIEKLIRTPLQRREHESIPSLSMDSRSSSPRRSRGGGGRSRGGSGGSRSRGGSSRGRKPSSRVSNNRKPKSNFSKKRKG